MSRPMGLHRTLNTLLASPEGKWHEIFLAMHELAICVSSRVNFKKHQDRQDAISEAVIYGMEQLKHYDPTRCSAVTYFGRVLVRHMLAGMADAHRNEHQHDVAFNDESSHSLLDSSSAHRMPGRTAARPSGQYRLTHPEEINKVRGLLDTSLARSLEALENSAQAAEKDQARICLMLLQQIRKLLLGRFNRIASDHLRLAPEGQCTG